MKKKTAKRPLWKNIIIVLAVIGVTSAILAQILFNITVDRILRDNDTYRLKNLIGDSIRALEYSFNSPDTQGRIVEANVYIAPGPGSSNNILYSTEYSSDNTSLISLSVTSRALIGQASISINSEDQESLFASLPDAQACARGFFIDFNNDKSDNPSNDSLTSVAIKTLKDGRQIEILREKGCSNSLMNELEQLLVNIESY